jgi:hypothetical protein
MLTVSRGAGDERWRERVAAQGLKPIRLVSIDIEDDERQPGRRC